MSAFNVMNMFTFSHYSRCISLRVNLYFLLNNVWCWTSHMLTEFLLIFLVGLSPSYFKWVCLLSCKNFLFLLDMSTYIHTYIYFYAIYRHMQKLSKGYIERIIFLTVFDDHTWSSPSMKFNVLLFSPTKISDF